MTIQSSCIDSSNKDELIAISHQYEQDKKQIANYMLNNIEFYRQCSKICDSTYRDYANFFRPYSHFYDSRKNKYVIAPISASQYLEIIVDTIVYNDSGLKCFAICGIKFKAIKSNYLMTREPGRCCDAKAFVGIRNIMTDSLTIYPFVKYSIFAYSSLEEACGDLQFLYFNKLKGETLSASYYSNKGFEQNVNDCDFFENSIIFQHHNDSTFNYQYCYKYFIKYPFMR